MVKYSTVYKINDFYVINTRYVPIGDLNSDQIIFYLKKGINGSEKDFQSYLYYLIWIIKSFGN